MSALALEFLIHTAARSGEVRFAVWKEFDMEEKIWTLPPARMKSFREHCIPLSDRASEILTALYELRTCNYVFPGRLTKGPLSTTALAAQLSRVNADAVDYTVHGFRSSFKDWASEVTHFPNELSEAALAHLTGDAAERAYRRNDVLEKRREMMNAWSRHLNGQLSDNVVPLVRVGT